MSTTTRFTSAGGYQYVAPFFVAEYPPFDYSNRETARNVYDAEQKWVAHCATHALAEFLAAALNEEAEALPSQMVAHEWTLPAVDAPFDSGDYPKAILLQSGDDIQASTCDRCGLPAEDWPSDPSWHGVGRPGAMYKAAMYCSHCFPVSYDEATGQRVSTYWGDPE